MANHKTSLSFARLPDTELNAFAGTVITKMTGNLNFPTPLVSMADLTAAQPGAGNRPRPNATLLRNENSKERAILF